MATSQTQPMRLEPKTFFANERTFLSWLHMAVTLGSISAALLGFAAGAHAVQMKIAMLYSTQTWFGGHFQSQSLPWLHMAVTLGSISAALPGSAAVVRAVLMHLLCHTPLALWVDQLLCHCHVPAPSESGLLPSWVPKHAHRGKWPNCTCATHLSNMA
eukprot:1150028-Pelagomonas_calceolata.AAC.7